jgi:hypothetical protein
MSPEERRDTFDALADRLWAIHSELERLLPDLCLEVDRKALKLILTNLTWANENCIVIGKHQVGEAMRDSMGMAGDGHVT